MQGIVHSTVGGGSLSYKKYNDSDPQKGAGNFGSLVRSFYHCIIVFGGSII